jgi:hypothetical protein
VLHFLLEVEFGMPARKCPATKQADPRIAVKPLAALKQRLGEARKREVERHYSGAEHTPHLEAKIQAELKVSTPFGVIVFSGFDLRR